MVKKYYNIWKQSKTKEEYVKLASILFPEVKIESHKRTWYKMIAKYDPNYVKEIRVKGGKNDIVKKKIIQVAKRKRCEYELRLKRETILNQNSNKNKIVFKEKVKHIPIRDVVVFYKDNEKQEPEELKMLLINNMKNNNKKITREYLENFKFTQHEINWLEEKGHCKLEYS